MPRSHDPRVIDIRTRLARATDPGTQRFLGFQLEAIAEETANDRAEVTRQEDHEQSMFTEDRYLGWLAGGVG